MGHFYIYKKEFDMNIIFVQGKIIDDIEFKFIINNKNNSIAFFKLKLLNKSIVKVKAYNELADYCYSKLNKGDIIFVEGYFNSDMEIIIEIINKSE